MSLRNPRAVTILALLVVLVVGVAIAFVFELLLPQALFGAIIIASMFAVGTVMVVNYGVRRRWVRWLGVPAAMLFGIGAIMLAEDIALAQSGERTEAVVVDHTVDVEEGAKGKSYTHHYTLEGADGQPLGEPMEYRGEDGFDDVDEGTTIEVLVDPDGEAPTKPADSIDIGAGIAAAIVGFLASAAVFGASAVSVARRAARTR